MQLIVKCSVCDVVMVTVEKDIISQEDVDMYQQNSLCGDHQVAIPTTTVAESDPEGEDAES